MAERPLDEQIRSLEHKLAAALALAQIRLDVYSTLREAIRAVIHLDEGAWEHVQRLVAPDDCDHGRPIPCTEYARERLEDAIAVGDVDHEIEAAMAEEQALARSSCAASPALTEWIG